MNGKLVISLDFELMWGVRDHRSQANYGDAVLGVRKAVPEMLKLFQAHGVRATWATVGFLLAKNRRHLLEYVPETLPDYKNEALSPYKAVFSEMGSSESDDPFHFGRSLFEQMVDTPGQEIGTHTFSHYYCLEDGQTDEAFEADLLAALRISDDSGVKVASIVFPRNQMTDRHVAICARHGVRSFRGNPEGFAYRSRPNGENTPLVRALRLADSFAPVLGRHSYDTARQQGNSIDVKASRFLRPYSPKLGNLHGLSVAHIIKEMRSAAKKGEIYHLWWHPHNFGRNTEINLAHLRSILGEFEKLREGCGMMSVNMGDFLQDNLM
jgi:peptidoglycan/xylan/chitin deacetylase (PgdA/CDA1 family)